MIPERVVRGSLEQLLGLEVPEKVWDKLVRSHFVADVQNDEVGATDELVHECVDLLALIGTAVPAVPFSGTMDAAPLPRPMERPKRGGAPSSMTTERESAISVLVWNEALREPEFFAFYERILGGRHLALEEVEPWIKERLAERPAPTLWLSDVPVPPGHSVEDGRYRWIIDPPLEVPWVGKTGDDTRRAWQVSQRFLQYVWHVPPDQYGRRYCPTAAGTVLDRLRQVSERLADRYGWLVDQATTFVLTGHMPWVFSSQANYRYRPISSLTRIELTVDPTLTPAEVADVYRRARRHALSGRHRSLSEKHLALAQFSAWRQEDERWADRMRAWNAEHPEWRYDEVRNFRRDCAQARERLLHPALDNDPYAANRRTGGDHAETSQP